MYKYYLSIEHNNEKNHKYSPLHDKVFYLESKCKEYFDSIAPKHIHGKPVHIIKENIETGEVFILNPIDLIKKDI